MCPSIEVWKAPAVAELLDPPLNVMIRRPKKSLKQSYGDRKTTFSGVKRSKRSGIYLRR